MSSAAHLLSVAQEVRDHIYAEIVKRIQSERCTLGFEGNPCSKYDGLRLSCRQLYRETKMTVFSFAFTSRQLTRIADIRANKATFQGVRNVAIEVPFESNSGLLQNVGSFLTYMQLSLQELRIFFIGKDRHGNMTNIRGCGNKPALNFSFGTHCLFDEGQDFELQWQLLRQIALLRNLRVLQIENANLPLSTSLLYNNKPYLQALSVTSDPRSVSSSLSRMPTRKVMEMHRNLARTVAQCPPLVVLSLSANSMPNVEGAVNFVSQNLRHFSWRVPNPDLQPYNGEQCLYGITNRLMHTLWWRAPQLETLRLCITMRERKPMTEILYRETARLTEELSHRLATFPALQNLEVHYSGFDGFFGEYLVERLPPSLSRLYLSDHTISATKLVAQVRKRYFTYQEDDGDETLTSPMPSTPAGYRKSTYHGTYVPQSDNNDVKSDYLGENDVARGWISCGESRDRYDDIPLGGGNLGFVDFEYTKSKIDSTPASIAYFEPIGIKIMRLNSQLLDREHHLHLAYSQLPGEPYGLRPPRETHNIKTAAAWPFSETNKFSNHPQIYTAIYDNDEWGPKAVLVEKNRQDLTKCFSMRAGPKWEWYFGNEDEAMDIFRREPVAKIEDQKRKPDIADVAVPEECRCRWACPDYEVPPIGSFPLPELPKDWRDHV